MFVRYWTKKKLIKAETMIIGISFSFSIVLFFFTVIYRY